MKSMNFFAKSGLSLAAVITATALFSACNKGGGDNGPAAPGAGAAGMQAGQFQPLFGAQCQFGNSPVGKMDIDMEREIIVNRTFRSVRGIGKEDIDFDSCIAVGDRYDISKTQPVLFRPGQQEMIFNFDSNGRLSITYLTESGEMVAVNPDTGVEGSPQAGEIPYRLDEETQSLVIEPFVLRGFPNDAAVSFEMAKSAAKARKAEKSYRDEYNELRGRAIGGNGLDRGGNNSGRQYGFRLGYSGGASYGPGAGAGQRNPYANLNFGPGGNMAAFGQPIRCADARPVGFASVPGRSDAGQIRADVGNIETGVGGIHARILVSPLNPQHIMSLYVRNAEYDFTSTIANGQAPKCGRSSHTSIEMLLLGN